MAETTFVAQIGQMQDKFSRILRELPVNLPRMPVAASTGIYDTLASVNELSKWTRRAVVAVSVRDSATPAARKEFFEKRANTVVGATMGASSCADAWFNSVTCMEGGAHGTGPVLDDDDEGECAVLNFDAAVCVSQNADALRVLAMKNATIPQ